MTSHAAVVGRQMGKPSVVGAAAIQVDEHAKQLTIGAHVLGEGDALSFDGMTGEVKVGMAPSQTSEILQVVAGNLAAEDSDIYRRFDRVMKWADAGASSRRARQRGPARPGEDRLRVRCPRHRAVSDRAYVLRGRPDPDSCSA